MEKETPTPQIINQETGQPFEIPIEGSLGLLALGSQGLKAWREKKKEAGLWPPKPVEIPKPEQNSETEK